MTNTLPGRATVSAIKYNKSLRVRAPLKTWYGVVDSSPVAIFGQRVA